MLVILPIEYLLYTCDSIIYLKIYFKAHTGNGTTTEMKCLLGTGVSELRNMSHMTITKIQKELCGETFQLSTAFVVIQNLIFSSRYYDFKSAKMLCEFIIENISWFLISRRNYR